LSGELAVAARSAVIEALGEVRTEATRQLVASVHDQAIVEMFGESTGTADAPAGSVPAPTPPALPPSPAPSALPPIVVHVPVPTPAAVPSGALTGHELIVAAARSRAVRTFLQGLGFDLLAALGGLTSQMAGLETLSKTAWVTFGLLVLKTVVMTTVAYIGRLAVTPAHEKPWQNPPTTTTPTTVVVSSRPDPDGTA
jgi:hypothetical protein